MLKPAGKTPVTDTPRTLAAMRRNANEYEPRWPEPAHPAADLRKCISRLEQAADPTDADQARQEALHHLAVWRDEMPAESRQAADAALALVGAACHLPDDTAAAERLNELAGLLELLEQQPAADWGTAPAPEQYRSAAQRLLYLLASADEASGCELSLRWHQQQNGRAPHPETGYATALESALLLPVAEQHTSAAVSIAAAAVHHRLEQPAPCWQQPAEPTPHYRGIVSLDIDDTIDLNDGYPAPISWTQVRELQDAGWMVGSCSDRPPSDQRRVWAEAGLTEAFAIPKELLHGLRSLHPELEVHHVGDSAERDELPALAQGVGFIRHTDFRTADFVTENDRRPPP